MVRYIKDEADEPKKQEIKKSAFIEEVKKQPKAEELSEPLERKKSVPIENHEKRFDIVDVLEPVVNTSQNIEKSEKTIIELAKEKKQKELEIKIKQEGREKKSKKQFNIMLIVVFVIIMLIVVSSFIYFQSVEMFESAVELVVTKDANKVEKIDLNKEINFIKSIDVLKQVVERSEVISGTFDQRNSMINELANKYVSRINIIANPQANSLKITFSDKDKDKVVNVLNIIVDIYNKGQKEVKPSEFAETTQKVQNKRQLEELMVKILDLEGQINIFTKGEQVLEVNPEIKALLDNYNMEKEISLENEIWMVDSRVAELQDIVRRKMNTSLSFIKETNVLNNFQYSYLTRKLIDLEFEKYIQENIFARDEQKIRDIESSMNVIKQKMLVVFKSNINFELNMIQESDLSIFIKMILTEIRQEVLFKITNQRYGVYDKFTSNQKRYLEIRKKLDSLIEEYKMIKDKQSQE